MNPVGRALWLIERYLSDEIGLESIAAECGVSRFHLSRAFGAVTGRSVMRYLRARRLTEAARQLADGAPDILTVALEVGYGSHEAFTRAFRDQFGLTPEQLRAQRHLENLALVGPFRMDETLIVEVAPPRIETSRLLLVAGFGGRFRFETAEQIPALWQRLGPHIGHVPNQVGWTSYGVCCNSDGAGSFDYVAAVEVSSFDDLPTEFTRVRIPSRRHAVFSHKGHISTIRATTYSVWNKYLPESGLKLADAPDFELYDQRFDPVTGFGEVEIWVPVEE